MMKIVLDAGFHGYVGIEYEGDKMPEPEGIRSTKGYWSKFGMNCHVRRQELSVLSEVEYNAIERREEQGSTMASATTESGLITVDQFYVLVEDGQKADLIDGVIYLASPDTLTHDHLCGFIFRLLGDYCEVTDSGEVFGSRFAFALSPTRAPEPDIAFVRRDRLHLVHSHGMNGGPDVAVEVISRDRRYRDTVEKKRLYEEAGVVEYWLLDSLQSRADFFRLVDGHYQLVQLEENHIFRSIVVPGFYLDVNWLFVSPLPKAYEKLQEILSSA